MVVVVVGKWGHNMKVQEVHTVEVEEVHKLREYYRQVHSSIGHYSPS